MSTSCQKCGVDILKLSLLLLDLDKLSDQIVDLETSKMEVSQYLGLVKTMDKMLGYAGKLISNERLDNYFQDLIKQRKNNLS